MPARPPPLPPRQRGSIRPPPPGSRPFVLGATDPLPTDLRPASARLSKVPRPAPNPISIDRESSPESVSPQTLRTDSKHDTEPPHDTLLDQDAVEPDIGDLAPTDSYSAELQPRRSPAAVTDIPEFPTEAEKPATNAKAVRGESKQPEAHPPPSFVSKPPYAAESQNGSGGVPRRLNADAVSVEELMTVCARGAGAPLAAAAALGVAVLMLLFGVGLGTSSPLWQAGLALISSVALSMVLLVHFALARTKAEVMDQLKRVEQLVQRLSHLSQPVEQHATGLVAGVTKTAQDARAYTALGKETADAETADPSGLRDSSSQIQRSRAS